jgi:hypothetical protein
MPKQHPRRPAKAASVGTSERYRAFLARALVSKQQRSTSKVRGLGRAAGSVIERIREMVDRFSAQGWPVERALQGCQDGHHGRLLEGL